MVSLFLGRSARKGARLLSRLSVYLKSKCKQKNINTHIGYNEKMIDEILKLHTSGTKTSTAKFKRYIT